MTTSPTTPVQVLCRQCAAPLPVEQGTQYATCEFCQTTNFIDKGRVVFHYAVRQTLRENDALAALRRWMAGNETVKGLDSQAQIEAGRFQLFPMWLVRANQEAEERVVMEPAAALSISELKRLTVPAASLELYDHALDNSAIEPTVPYEMMLEWLANDHNIQPADIREVSLVHLPIYLFKYSFDGRQYTAVVDAATSKVFANIFPTKWEAPYVALAAIAFAAYFCASCIPGIGLLAGEWGGFAIGGLLYIVFAVGLAIPIFMAAAYISAKV